MIGINPPPVAKIQRLATAPQRCGCRAVEEGMITVTVPAHMVPNAIPEQDRSGSLYRERSGHWAQLRGENVIYHRLLISKFLAGADLLIATKSLLLSQPAPSSAKDVFVRFCELDAQGELLTAEGWEKASANTSRPSARPGHCHQGLLG